MIQVITPSDTVDESDPLRFGDPETSAGEEPSLSPSPQPTEFATVEPITDPGEKIREIIASVPPGNEYPQQLEEIVEFGVVGVPTLTLIFEDASAPWQSRWIAGMALGRLGTSPAREALEKGLKDPLFLVRMAAIEALTRAGGPSIAPALRNALSDRAMVVRSKAVDSLERFKDREAVPELVKELASPRNFHRGRSFWIRERIVDALGNIGGEKTIPALLSVLRENEMNLRLRACLALAKVSPDAGPATTLSSDEKCVEQWWQWGLAWAASQSKATSPPSQSAPP